MNFAETGEPELLEINGGRRFKADPMIGVAGTAAKGDRPWFSIEAGNHGGNMDNNAVKAGATVYLPVFTEGGLLGIGDVHAAMGDGEVFGSGVDIAADVETHITLGKDMKILRPFIRSEDMLATMAAADTMEEASALCAGDMADLLRNEYRLAPADASLAIALFADLKVCQIVNPQKSMRMELPLRMLDQFRFYAKQ